MTGNPEWHTEAFPELRAQPPWVMQDMIAAQPTLAQTLLSTPPPGVPAAANTITKTLARHQLVTVCGCGTSEHAAAGIAALIADAVGPDQAPQIRARPAFSAALDPTPGVCLAVSHDGGTHATALALQAARSAGAHTIAITHQPDARVAETADQALITPTHDDSWCHTVAYTSALATGATIAAHLGSLPADPAAVNQLLTAASAVPDAAAIAQRLADRRVILCTGAEPDLPTARELALKIAEATHIPTIALELETVLHGQLAAHDTTDALILVAINQTGDPIRTTHRAADVARAAKTIGLRIAALVSDTNDHALDKQLTPDGRLITTLPAPDFVHPRLAALLAGAGALQTLTLELAHARNTNPDLIRREQPRYRHAAQAAENSDSW